MHRTISVSRQENITYSLPDRLTPDSLPSLHPPKECTDGRRTLTSQPKFLGWIVNQIFLAMGLHVRARTRGALLLIKYRENYTVIIILDYNLFKNSLIIHKEKTEEINV